MIYLDNAGTTFPGAEKAGGDFRPIDAQMEERVRRGLQNLTHAGDDMQMVLAPSATVALGWIATGLRIQSSKKMYLTPYEHVSEIRALQAIQRRVAFIADGLPVTEQLEIDLDKTEELFAEITPHYVIMNHVSNVTGYILPVEEICAMAKKYHAVTMVDGSQALGVVPVDLQTLQADIYIFTGHKKLYAPPGIGGFFLRDSMASEPAFFGRDDSAKPHGGMSEKDAKGAEVDGISYAAAAGLCDSLDELAADGEVEARLLHEQRLAGRLRGQLRQIPGVVLDGQDVSRAVGTVSFHLPSCRSETVSRRLAEEYHIEVPWGSHQTSTIHNYLQYDDESGILRASVGRDTVAEDVDALARAVEEIAGEVE